MMEECPELSDAEKTVKTQRVWLFSGQFLRLAERLGFEVYDWGLGQAGDADYIPVLWHWRATGSLRSALDEDLDTESEHSDVIGFASPEEAAKAAIAALGIALDMLLDSPEFSKDVPNA